MGHSESKQNHEEIQWEQRMKKIDLETKKQLSQFELESREKELCEKKLNDENKHFEMMHKQCSNEYDDLMIRKDAAWKVYKIMNKTRPLNHIHIKESKKKYDTICNERDKLYEKCSPYT